MRKLIRKSNKGFTLIELMIVVAIIGILAAIAIPNFLRFQLRSKTSEGKVNIAAIRTAEESYVAEFGSYVAAATSPAANGMSQKQVFTDIGAAGANFSTIGWAPEGNVFFNYSVAIAGLAYTADSSADIDNNGTNQVWGYVHPDPLNAVVLGTLSCVGIYDAVTMTAILTNVVGPCGAVDGQSEF